MLRPIRFGHASASKLGAAAVEFAIVLPFLLLCVLGLIEFARVVWTQSTLDYAVQAAARCAAIDPNTCGSNPVADHTLAQQFAIAKGLPSNADFTVASQSCGLQVTASLWFDFLAPILPYSQTLIASACFPTNS